MQPILQKHIVNSPNIRIEFAGFVDPVQLPKYYAASDIYIHPSKVDPHPLAISEAIYMGCPVIVSDRCGSYGINDDVQEGQNGLVYKWGNIVQLKNSIMKLATDNQLRNDFGNYSHEIAVESQLKSHGFGLQEALADHGFKLS